MSKVSQIGKEVSLSGYEWLSVLINFYLCTWTLGILHYDTFSLYEFDTVDPQLYENKVCGGGCIIFSNQLSPSQAVMWKLLGPLVIDVFLMSVEFEFATCLAVFFDSPNDAFWFHFCKYLRPGWQFQNCYLEIFF